MAAPLHIVMFPWSAFGHMIPYFQLSVALAKAGVRVTYVSTPRNIQRLPGIPPSLKDLLKYQEVAMPKVEGLPNEAEATVDVVFEQIQYLKKAHDLLEEPFSQIVADQRPDWLVTDFASYWACRVGAKFGIPHMWFSVFNTATLAFIGPKEYLVGEGQRRLRSTPENLTTKPTWIPFPSSVAYKAHEARGFHAGLYGENASGTTDAERAARILDGCHAVAIRTCKEVEGEYMELYESLVHRPVIATGLLPPEPRDEDDLSESWGWIFEWLNEQKSRSVVFVGFGSEYRLTKEEVDEIAYGLELSGLPFLWALRRPKWAAEERDALPEGFRDRTSGRGMVCLGWAPQKEILAHPSVGGSLLHSGWSSVIESLQYGHSLVVLPCMIDQGPNARLLADKDLAIEVERKDDGKFSRDDVARALRRAMVEEEGEKLRAKARNAADVFGDAKLHQEHYIGGLVEYMKNVSRPSA